MGEKPSTVSGTSTQPNLIPPDLKRCQCDKPNGVNFMTMGGGVVGGKIRCANKPAVIITEKEPGEDGLRGSMSLCRECLVVFNEQDARNVYVELLR